MNFVVGVGGLANQIHQYVFARYLEILTKKTYVVDDLHLFLRGQGAAHNGFELDRVFPHINLKKTSDFLTPLELEDILQEKKDNPDFSSLDALTRCGFYLENLIYPCYPSQHEENPEFHNFKGKTLKLFRPTYEHHEVPILWPGSYYVGVWSEFLYFDAIKEQMWKELQFPPILDEINRNFLNKIQSTTSVAVHVRRGDFVTLGLDLPPEQYATGVTQVKETLKHLDISPNFFFFSDQIPWCKEHYQEFGFTATDSVIFVEGNTGNGMNYIDMQLISHCDYVVSHHFSTFSRCGALLNPNLVKHIMI